MNCRHRRLSVKKCSRTPAIERMRLPMFAIHHNALAYSMTTLGSCMMTSIFSFYYVKLFLNKYQISEGAFHQAQVLYMIWNAVNDPLFGYIQDNSRVRCCARRRLSILYGAPFYALAFLLPWFPWKTYEAGDALSGLHLIVSLFAYDGMLTFVLLAQCALFAEISGQHENRLTLIKYSQIASLVGSCSVLFCGLVSDNMENFPYFQGFTIAVAFLACACMLYTGMYTISQYDKEDWKGSGEREQKAEVAGMSLTAVFSMTRQIVTQKDFLCFVSMNFCQVFLVAFYSNFAMIFTEHLIPQGALPSSVKSILYGAGFICPQLLVLSSQNLLRRLGYYRIILCTFYLEALASALVFLLGRQHYNILALYLIGSMVLVQATFSLFNLPLADIIDTDLQKHQRSSPLSSMVFGTNALFTKPAQSLAPMLVVTILNQFDYEKMKEAATSTLDLRPQLQPLHEAMFYLVCLLPACVALLQMLVWKPFSIRDSHIVESKYVES
ncbi:transmembrane protein 180 [Polypterus senegalus]|uniref:transmembrane protein 180 n=1 Tax=Polypterus senegalus TaxID=55291 RepID=UPI001965FFD0|nr:transmembrane protein 180 [Polypterus senegalus]XP_039630674.1 transmembrane protein 180 [Polypterus senegalus]